MRSKFDPSGAVQRFPGNTIICRLPPSAPLYGALRRLHADLERSAGLSHLYALLPPSSWHMTVFEGACDQVRRQGYWPTANLPLDATASSLDECTALFRAQLDTFGCSTGTAIARRLPASRGGLRPPRPSASALRVEAASAEENARIRGLRDRLAHVLCIRHPQHEAYGLHISVAYLLRHPDPAQRRELESLLQTHLADLVGEFELGSPEFCTFEDMLRFDRVFYLGPHGSFSRPLARRKIEEQGRRERWGFLRVELLCL